MTFQDYLPFGLAVENLLVVGFALSAGLTGAAIWYSLLDRDPGAQRAKALAKERQLLRDGALGTGQTRRRKERTQALSFMRQTVEKLRLLRSSQAEKISLKLMRAGWRSKDAVIRYLFAKLVMPIVFAILVLLQIKGIATAFGVPTTGALAIALGIVLLGAYAPDIFIRNAANKRKEKIRKSLPDGLDLMVICAEAGLSLDATLMRVSQEMALAAPELSDEFSVTALELSFLPDRKKALQNLAARTDLSALRGMVNTLVQSERYGTPLAQSLRVLSKESRDERVLRAEEKAARLPAILTVPMIVFILPPLFVVLVGPAALNVIDALKSM
ncbi:MAG: type II secretion system F family protein [Kiloniellales bacterium]